MKILFDINHSAHVHFFRNLISLLIKTNNSVLVLSRKNKENVCKLLDNYGIEHIPISSKTNSLHGNILELFSRNMKILSLARKFNPDFLLGITSNSIGLIGSILRKPSICFGDTEHSRLGNYISFIFASHVFSPTCYNHDMGRKYKRQLYYPGYHEFSYITPSEFIIDKPKKKRFLFRTVAWDAVHDIGDSGLNLKQKIDIVNILKKYGEVIISSEGDLPKELNDYVYRLDPNKIHDVMKTCSLVIGESATMTSEAACMGIPSIFISQIGRGYTTEQDIKYDLVRHFTLNQWDEIVKYTNDWASSNLFEEWQLKRNKMLNEKIDVTSWIFNLLDNYPSSIKMARNSDYEKYKFTII